MWWRWGVEQEELRSLGEAEQWDPQCGIQGFFAE